MDRRGFLGFLGVGIGATVANAQVKMLEPTAKEPKKEDVTIICGAHHYVLPVSGDTVESVSSFMKDLFAMDRHVPYVNGNLVRKSYILQPNDQLEWFKS
jgi:hypothetical protein